MPVRLYMFLVVFLGAVGSAMGSVGTMTNQQVSELDALLLTEVYYDTPGTDGEEEWIELANLGPVALDLTGVKLGDEESRGRGEGMAQFPDGARIDAGQVIVVAQTASGLRALFGRAPDYELSDSDPQVPDMGRYSSWATGDVALANDGDEVLLLDKGDQLVDAVSYGDSEAYFRPSVADVHTGQSIERIPANCDSNSAADWQPRTNPTPGEVSLAGECQSLPSEMEPSPRLPIGVIQGRQDVSSYVNRVVTLRGVVTGFYEDRNTRGATFYTMFVQDLPGTDDGDPMTSDGIAVFLGPQRPAYRVGDQLQISGQITEFFGLTEVNNDNLQMTYLGGDGLLLEPITIDPPADNEAQAAYFEALEGMLVSIEGQISVIGPSHSGCGFAVAHANGSHSRILARAAEDPVGNAIPVLHHSDVDCSQMPSTKSGDLVTGIRGPLTYNFDRFKIVNQDASSLTVTAAPFAGPPSPAELEGSQISIATINLSNHFDAFDDTGDDSEPKPAPEAIAAKQTKLAYLIGSLLGCPTLVGVQEVENRELLRELADEMAEHCGFTYDVSHLDSPDVRGIDVALLSDPRRVSVSAVRLRQACSPIDTGIHDPEVECTVGMWPLFSRPPIQVDCWIDELKVTVFVNHFKSKREGAEVTAARRLGQAEHINRLVGAILEQDASARIVVMGDFNDYEASPAMQLMTGRGTPLVNSALQIPSTDRYTFIFDGVSQLIDGILLSQALDDSVIDIGIIHTNSDFPYTLSEDASPGGLPYRATDHDPILLILDLVDDSPVTNGSGQISPSFNLPATTTVESAATVTETTAPDSENVSPIADNEEKVMLIGAVLLGAFLLLLFVPFVMRRRPR